MFNKKDQRFSKWRPSLFKSLSKIAEKESNAKQPDLRKTRRAYARERTKRREHLNNEVAHVDKLFKARSIDENTHARYKKLLEMSYAQKRQETREKYGFTN
jgi:DNA-binding protein H-NS